jgi:hypothetical protein
VDQNIINKIFDIIDIFYILKGCTDCPAKKSPDDFNPNGNLLN